MRGPDIPVREPRVFQQEGGPSPETPGPPTGELIVEARKQEEGRRLGRRSLGVCGLGLPCPGQASGEGFAGLELSREAAAVPAQTQDQASLGAWEGVAAFPTLTCRV